MSKDSPGEGNPHPYISRKSSAGKRNVGAGLAPALHPPPALLNPDLHPPPSQHPPPAQQTPPALLNSAQQTSSEWLKSTFQPFADGLQQLGLELTEQQFDQFLRYKQELLDWNTRINLTAINDPAEIMLEQFLDSLSLLMLYEVSEVPPVGI